MRSNLFFILSFLIALFTASQVQAQLGKSYSAYQDKNGLWGFQEIKLDFSYGGKSKYPVRIKAQFDEVSRDWFEDICAVKKDGKWGYVDSKGKMVTPFQYEEANREFVKMNGKWGTIDKNGSIVIPCTFTQLRNGGALNIASEDDTKYGYVDDNGKIVIPFMYEACFPFDGSSNIVKTATGYEVQSSNALAKVKLNGRYGLIDISNKYVLYPKFEDIWNFFGSSPYTWVSLNGTNYGVVNRSGRFLMPTWFRDVETLDASGEAKASAPRFNTAARLDADAYTSKGLVSVTKRTYTDRYKTYSIDNVEQNYLSKKDSVTFGLLKKPSNNNRIEMLKIYQEVPSGYLAARIAMEYLADSLDKASVQQGIEWLKKGIESHNDALCAVEFSSLLINGYPNVPKDENKAFLLLNKTMSDIVKDPSILEKYDDLATDEDEADAIFEMLTEGFRAMAYCYMNGIGTGKDEKQAISWFEKGVNLGDPYCGLILGDLYYKGGQTATKDPAKALSYYEIAADGFIADAMYKAANMYLDGIGTVKNRDKAIALLKKASSLTHKEAKELLIKLGE